MAGKTYDLSIRVSRMGKGKDQDRRYTVASQDDAGRKFAKDRGDNVGTVAIERNVSGGKAARDRDIERLVKRVEMGLSDGVIVYDFSRLTREDAFAATMLVGRIKLAGGRVLGVADGYDSEGPMAAVMTAIFADQAHSYLETCRDRSGRGQREARERGAYVGRHGPGYDRLEDGTVVENAQGALIREIFARKLRGDSYAELVRFASENGLPITTGGIRTILRNRMYIGDGPGGASPAIVDRETFDRVQAMMSNHRRKATGAGARTLSQGLARCANCGSALVLTNTSTRPLFFCRGLRLGGCDRRGAVSAHLLDAYVESCFLAAFRDGGPMAQAYADATAVEETSKDCGAAAYELEHLKGSTSLVSSLGIKAYEEVVANAAAKLELAEEAHQQARANAETVTAVAGMLDLWPSLDTEKKRRLLAVAVERINIGKGRVPVERKAQLVFTGGVVADAQKTPGRASSSLRIRSHSASTALSTA